ncbi:MAG: hypothetical protein F6K28_57345, partial [Microcoleus sp. SIO2G3]|nr:hypothetical protein [Microcoleus sp. SIO2G3]
DTRLGRETIWTFNAAEASVYQAINTPITLKQLYKNLYQTPGELLSAAQVEAVLERFVNAELALYDERFYLGIAVAQGTVDPPFEFRRCQFANEPANQLSASRKKLEVARIA